jgi:hypothetical protein
MLTIMMTTSNSTSVKPVEPFMLIPLPACGTRLDFKACAELTNPAILSALRHLTADYEKRVAIPGR